MNILMLTAYPPILNMHGGGVRMYHNIRILSQKHNVSVITFVENDQERERLQSLRGICESITAIQRVPDYRPHWLSLDPFLIQEFSTPAMLQAIDTAVEKTKPDVMQYEYLQMTQYRRAGIFSILTIHETLSANAYRSFEREIDPVLKLKAFYEWMRMLRYEVMATRKFDRTVTMTSRDAEYLRSYSPSADIRAVPIGIDAAEFMPLPEEPDRPVEILFVGNFRHTPNVEAAAFLAREIAPHFPATRFVIQGSNVPHGLVNAQNVIAPGYAPDIRVVYNRPNTIVAVPIFSGTGQRVKLLEALSMGCAVVTTSLGAEGFPIRHGTEALVADSAEEFRAALRRLIDSIELRRELGRRARFMIQHHFDWANLAESFTSLTTSACSQGSKAATTPQ